VVVAASTPAKLKLLLLLLLRFCLFRHLLLLQLHLKHLSERFFRVTTQINLPCFEISQSLRTELHFWFEKRSEDRKREREIVEAEAEERKHERGEENRRE
jgi:hypothetical protein